jgi:multidrug resistance protein, MATE family
MTYQIPFAVSVALSTRVGNLLGATLGDAARVASNVGCVVSATVGLLNGYFPIQKVINISFVLYFLRGKWGYLFSDDVEVIKLVIDVMPYCALFQVRYFKLLLMIAF